MSLLSRLPDVATVYPTVPVDDGYGGTRPGAGAPVVVACRVQPAGAVEGEPQRWPGPRRLAYDVATIKRRE